MAARMSEGVDVEGDFMWSRAAPRPFKIVLTGPWRDGTFRHYTMDVRKRPIVIVDDTSRT